MIDTLNYNEVPFHFVHCFRTECPKASSCLRYQATRFLPADKRCVKALNPTFVGNPAECQEYLSDTPVIYASGISRLFDELPYAKAKDVKDDIISLIGKSQYYRMKNKTIGISPLQQHTIKTAPLRAIVLGVSSVVAVPAFPLTDVCTG